MKRSTSPTEDPTFPAMLRARAEAHPDRIAVTFIDDSGDEQSLTYQALWERCREVAAALTQTRIDGPQTPPVSGRRALLLFPPGLDFLPALIGAQSAGWIPVPTCYPKPHRSMPRLNSAAVDCRPSVLLSDTASLAVLDRSKLEPAISDIRTLAVDSLSDAAASGTAAPESPAAESIAFLQYTSGSTSSPKGVMVSQRNVMTNLEIICKSFGIPTDFGTEEPVIGMFWLPFYHDMGLIGGILSPLFAGGRAVLMSPQAFIRRPITWLQAVQRHRATVTGAPNFAYELCTDRISPDQAAELDLSSLRVAFCGAEPIRAAALRSFATRFAPAGFSSRTYYPCYGLAEATLLVTGGNGPAVPKVIEVDREDLRSGRVSVSPQEAAAKRTTLVSCGMPAGDTEVIIVDPQTRRRLPDDRIGEVWIRGDSVSDGYWSRPEENAARFQASPAASSRSIWNFLGIHRREENGSGEGSGNGDNANGGTDAHYFRTGDLGFFHEGELYISGRLTDTIIIRGRNYFPNDIESSLASLAHIPFGRVAALAAAGPRGETLAVIAEIDRNTSETEIASIVRQIRRTIIDEHEIDPRQVVLVRPATLPVTTSGKIQRSRCRSLLETDFRGTIHRWQRNSSSEASPLPLPELPSRLSEEDYAEVCNCVQDWIVRWLAVRGENDAARIDVNQSFEDYGLDSLMAIEMIGDLEDSFDVELTPSVAAEHPTILRMAHLIAAKLCGLPEDQTQVAVAGTDR